MLYAGPVADFIAFAVAASDDKERIWRHEKAGDETGGKRNRTGDDIDMDRQKTEQEKRENIKITWMGTATFLLEAAGERILFDPFVPIKRRGKIPAASMIF